MQAAIDRVLETYGMMVNLTPEEEQATRRRLKIWRECKRTITRLPLRAFATCGVRTDLTGREGSYSAATRQVGSSIEPLGSVPRLCLGAIISSFSSVPLDDRLMSALLHIADLKSDVVLAKAPPSLWGD